MTKILSLLTNLFSNKWVRGCLLMAVVLCALYSCAGNIRDSIYQEGYKAGVSYQTQVELQIQTKAKQEFDVLQAKADQDRVQLNKEITNLSKTNSQLKLELQKKVSSTNKEKIDYAKTVTGTMSCFAPRDNGLFIINNSFPSSVDRSVQSNSDSGN